MTTKKEAPPYKCPFDFYFHPHHIVYATLDMKFVEQLEKAREKDRARQTVEWLKYYLLEAQEKYKKLNEGLYE